MTSHPTSEQIAEFHEAFTTFKQNGADIKGMEEAMQDLGQDFTPAEIEDLVNAMEENDCRNSDIEFSVFVTRIMWKILTNELIKCFRFFDTEDDECADDDTSDSEVHLRGLITTANLRYILTTKKLAKSEENIDEIVRIPVSDSESMFDYEYYAADIAEACIGTFSLVSS
eukprot:TRINITY_DN27415_c0_g1_i1.p1 TRINITY_DN27415_c0_g1~~TRINITY_DN27415_c0_g1_i1.p1  ORF type:complete len:170 (+),score=36.08 TRINITY_DN27415_c0_g1_i1:53-562(+)